MEELHKKLEEVARLALENGVVLSSVHFQYVYRLGEKIPTLIGTDINTEKRV
jgi:hypothetical protein